MPQEVKIKKVYAAGIVNSKDQWSWQGTAVAHSIAEAKQLLTAYKKSDGIKGRCEVTDMNGPNYTNRPIGIYQVPFLIAFFDPKKGPCHSTDLF